MCGILGSVPRSEQTTFKTALDRIAHRGPDAEGIIHLSEISLGHRRLSILDLTESGSQPMFSSDQRYIIAYNGEIYNYLEIRAVLEKDGFSFKTESDTEIVLAAYIKWGPACLSKFNGMWAISIWDKQTKELFVSRDRFGKKPFFYIHDQERFIFASEMKSLLPFLSEIKPHPDFERMKEAPFSYESTERCLIQGIKRFPAGSFAFLRSNKLCIKRFWNTLDHLQAPSSNYEKQVEEFQELFIDSCKLRLRSDVPIGTALSGGLDSSATIGVATNLARTNNKPTPKAFVASFPQSTIDETPYAQRVIDHLKIDSKIIPINPILEWKKILEYIYLTEELYLTSPIPMIMTYREIKKDGVSVTLDGHGADELFSGYGHIREAYVDAPYSSKNFSEIYEALHGYPGSSLEIWKESLQVKSKDMAKHLLQRGISSKDSNHENFKKLDHFSKHLYVIFHETILPTLIRNYDRYSMAS